MKIVKPGERGRGAHVKVCVVGVAGIGKTTLAKQLAEAGRNVVFVDLESGTLSLGDAPVTLIQPTSWSDLEVIAAIVGGPDPQGGTYTDAFVGRVLQEHADIAEVVRAADVVYVDSFSYASRVAYADVMRDPPRGKGGQVDMWGVYRGVADRMVPFTRALQRAQQDVVMSALLEIRGDSPPAIQVQGAAAERELPGIFDIIVSYVRIAKRETEDGRKELIAKELATPGMITPELRFNRVFVCKENPFLLPAKDRSGRLSLYEQPDIVALLDKARGKVKE